MRNRILTFPVMVLVILILSGCGKGKKSYTYDDFMAVVPGTPRTEIIKRFGEPDGELSGMYGDIYVAADSVQIIVYYDRNSRMSEVKIPAMAPQAPFTAGEIFDNLLRALDDTVSLRSLEHFFVQWNKSFFPNDECLKSNEAIHAIYSVYREFFRPHDLTSLGDPEWGNRLNAQSQYVVVQDKIKYGIAPVKKLKIDDYKEYPLSILSGFRPEVNIEADRVLYLTEEYRQALTDVLELLPDNFIILSTDNYYRRLMAFIPVLCGHWSKYFHLETHPYVLRIIFNNDLSQAKIDFRIGYQGGSAILEKEDDIWVLRDSRLTWIE